MKPKTEEDTLAKDGECVAQDDNGNITIEKSDSKGQFLQVQVSIMNGGRISVMGTEEMLKKGGPLDDTLKIIRKHFEGIIKLNVKCQELEFDMIEEKRVAEVPPPVEKDNSNVSEVQ